MTRKAYTVGPNVDAEIWDSDKCEGVPVEAGQTVWVDLENYRVDEDGDVRAFGSPDVPSQDYGYIKFTDLTPVSEVDDSGFNHETGAGNVKVGARSVYVTATSDPAEMRSDADYYEAQARANRAVADWLETREANDPVKKAAQMLADYDGTYTDQTLAKYLIEKGVVFP